MREHNKYGAQRAIPLDLFLYSCLEYERLRRSSPEGTEEIQGHPSLKSEPEQGTKGFEDDSVSELDDVVAWYRCQFQSLAGQEVLSSENLSSVVIPTVLLGIDVASFTLRSKGSRVPFYIADEITRDPFWSEFDGLVVQHFSAYAEFMMTYYHWCFSEERENLVEPGSRPPVGRFAPRFPRSQKFKDRNSFSPQGRRNQDSDDRHGRPSRPQRKFDDRNRGDHERGGFRGNPNSGPRSEASRKAEELALKDVAKAVREFKGKPETEEVLLAPTNSFCRRLQHRHINEAGFFSRSIGEGQDRAVKITRIKQPSDESSNFSDVNDGGDSE